jgi:PPM family protein phosphatase
MPLLSTGLTDIGKKRSTNQDAIYLDEKERIFIVADGMGGHNGGDIASQLATKSLPLYLSKKIHQVEKVEEFLEQGILHSNEVIRQEGIKNPKLMGMGTTVSMCYFKASYVYVANIGDSRTYLINNHCLYQMTIDHSLIQEKLNYGIYTREQAAKDPHKNVLVRTVGFEEDIDVDIFRYQISRGDLFMICSDGLYGKVSDEDVIYVINKYIPIPTEGTKEMLEQAARVLIDQANKNGGNDNISIILILAK